MTRSAEDAALVFDAVRDVGTASGDLGFPFDGGAGARGMTVGYVPALFEGDNAGSGADRATLEVLRRLGVELVEVALPDGPEVGAVMDVTLTSEAAAAFDGLTRSGDVDQLVRQERFAWPNTFRHGRLIPAVEYINAQRIRQRLVAETEAAFDRVSAIVTPSFGGTQLALTNVTGHPAVCIPNGFFPPEASGEAAPDMAARRSPHSITFLGPLYGDHAPLALAHAVQGATDWHRRRPPVGA